MPRPRRRARACATSSRSALNRSTARRLPASPSRRRRPASSTQALERRRERARVARRHEQPGLAVEHDLRRPADRRRDDRPGMGHRLEHDQRQPLRPRRQREDVQLAEHVVGVALAREHDAVANAPPLGLGFELALDRPRPARGRGRRARRARPGRARAPRSARAAPSRRRAARPRRSAASRRRGRARGAGSVRRGRVDVDAVVEHLDALRIALALVRAASCSRRPRRVATRAAPSCCRALAGASRDAGRKWFSMCRCETTGTPAARPRDGPARSPQRGCACGARRLPRERRSRASCSAPTTLVRAADVAKRDLVAEVAHAVDERTAARRHEQHVVAARAQRVREPKRDELSAGDVAADHEVRDLHARQTATSSVASAIASRSIAIAVQRDVRHRGVP